MRSGRRKGRGSSAEGGEDMPKASNRSKVLSRREADELFRRANDQWDHGKIRSAFRLFLSGAKAGDPGAENDLGYFYDTGTAVKRNRQQAVYWYKRAYRHGNAAGASNIGTILRDEGKTGQALLWFQRAIKLGDADSNLEVAKILQQKKGQTAKAITYLRRVTKAW